MNEDYFMEMVAYHKIQEALRLKRANSELLQLLIFYLNWMIHYCKKNRIALPEKQKLIEMLNRISQIQDKITS
jgi:hypothetical protein